MLPARTGRTRPARASRPPRPRRGSPGTCPSRAPRARARPASSRRLAEERPRVPPGRRRAAASSSGRVRRPRPRAPRRGSARAPPGATPDFDSSPERFTSTSAEPPRRFAAESESSEWTSSTRARDVARLAGLEVADEVPAKRVARSAPASPRGPGAGSPPRRRRRPRPAPPCPRRRRTSWPRRRVTVGPTSSRHPLEALADPRQATSATIPCRPVRPRSRRCEKKTSRVAGGAAPARSTRATPAAAKRALGRQREVEPSVRRTTSSPKRGAEGRRDLLADLVAARPDPGPDRGGEIGRRRARPPRPRRSRRAGRASRVEDGERAAARPSGERDRQAVRGDEHASPVRARSVQRPSQLLVVGARRDDARRARLDHARPVHLPAPSSPRSGSAPSRGAEPPAVLDDALGLVVRQHARG